VNIIGFPKACYLQRLPDGVPAMRPQTKRDFVNVAELIRSIQRTEGNPDCFQTARGYCDRSDCTWRSYCLDLPAQALEEQTNSGDENQELPRHHEKSMKSEKPKGESRGQNTHNG
jgi:hypothetical protein